MVVYITGSRLGGWHCEKSDVDVLILSNKPEDLEKHSAFFRFGNTFVDIHCRSRKTWLRKYDLGYYNIDTGQIEDLVQDHVVQYVEHKKRSHLLNHIDPYLTSGIPCPWFMENKEALINDICRFMVFWKQATLQELMKARKIPLNDLLCLETP